MAAARTSQRTGSSSGPRGRGSPASSSPWNRTCSTWTIRITSGARPRIQGVYASSDRAVARTDRGVCRELLESWSARVELSSSGTSTAPPRDGDRRALRYPCKDQRVPPLSNRIVSISSGPTLAGPPCPLAFYLPAEDVERHGPRRRTIYEALVQAEESGDTLGGELLAMSFLLLVAGHETTVNLIASGTLVLLEHPDQLEKLEDESRLIKPAVEELLRYTSPVEIATRLPCWDLEISGTTVPRGELVLAVLARQPRRSYFEDPDTLNLARDPNRHLPSAGACTTVRGAVTGWRADRHHLLRFPNLHLDMDPGRSSREDFVDCEVVTRPREDRFARAALECLQRRVSRL